MEETSSIKALILIEQVYHEVQWCERFKSDMGCLGRRYGATLIWAFDGGGVE